jgi:tripartite-type tricarboxylate transporter receptor subunit TctC
MNHVRNLSLATVSLITASLFIHAPSYAEDVAAFYSHKTVNVYIGYPPGGGYDIYSRIVIRHLGKHIPGNPSLIPLNMPGGGSRVAASYLYNVAPKNGLALGVFDQGLPFAEALGEKTKFHASEFRWIGSPDYDVRIVTTWHTSGIATIADAKKKMVTMGTVGVSEALGYPDIINALAGTKFKAVKGYRGGVAVDLAMERGEVDGRADNAWTSLKSQHADWIRENKVYVLVQVGLSKAPDLPDVPLLLDLARNSDDRKALELISTPSSMGHPLVAPPGIPEDRVRALRQAFKAMVADSAFLADAKKMRRPIRPVSGERLEQIVKDLLSAPERAKARAKALAGR